MKKLTSLLMTVLAVGALTVSQAFANPSQNGNGQTVGTPMIDGKEVVDVTIVFEDEVKEVTTEVLDVVQKLNSGEDFDQVIDTTKVINETSLDLKEMNLLTKFQDLVVKDENGNIIKDAKNVTVTWEVPNLKSDLGDVAVLHYSTVRNVYEVLKPSNVDFNKKTVTCTFPDLSPVSVVYQPKAKTEAPVVEKEEEKSSSSNMLLFAGVGGVVVVAVVAVVLNKKKNK